jgi:hypothetical protein
VITSDRQLSDRAKNIGAQILSTELFIVKIHKPLIDRQISGNKTDPQVKKEDISYWLDKFDSKE